MRCAIVRCVDVSAISSRPRARLAAAKPRSAVSGGQPDVGADDPAARTAAATPSSETPSSAASRRATGVARWRPLVDARAAGRRSRGLAAGRRRRRRDAGWAGDAGRRGAGGAAPSTRTRAITAPSAAGLALVDDDLLEYTVELCLVDDRRLVGLHLDERLALATASPGCLSHWRMVASSIESESFGIPMSTMAVAASALMHNPGRSWLECVGPRTPSRVRQVRLNPSDAAEHDPDRIHGLVAVVVEPVRDRRLEGDRVAGLEHVLLETDGHPELAADHDPELPAVWRTSLPSGLDAPPTS